MPENETVDQAILGYLRASSNGTSERLLAATGEAGVRRMLSIHFGEATEPFSFPPELSRRGAIDLLSAALRVVATATPAAFITGLAGRDLSGLGHLSVLAILGGVDDPRATGILCSYVGDEEWLTRYNAVSALVRRADPVGRGAVESALSDSNLVVRAEAIKGVSRWDKARAIALYKGLLAEEAITPLLRADAEAAIRDLRAGRPVQE